MVEFSTIKGFSNRNLEQIRRWYIFYISESSNAKQVATQLFQVPWWHNVLIVSKVKSKDEALFYISKTIEDGWSRAVLTHKIEAELGEFYDRI